MKVPEPRKLSSGNYFIQLRLGGESVPVTAPTEKECRNMAALIKAEHRAGIKRIADQKNNPTLGHAIDNYIAARSNMLSPSTIRGYQIIRKNRFQSVMDKKLKDIKDWQSICNREAKLMSAKSLKNSWSLISAAMREVGAAVPSVKLPQIVAVEQEYLTPEQIEVFIKAVKDERCEIAALLGLSSLRCSEICALTWENVDIKKRVIHVRGAAVLDKDNNLIQKETNKNRSSRRSVPIMIPELVPALSAVKDKSGLVVSQHPSALYHQINAVCKKNDLPLVGIHGLRHSFASLAYHLGMPEQVAMQIGGWSDYGTMRRIYTHISQKDIEKYAGQMKQFYKNANGNANRN